MDPQMWQDVLVALVGKVPEMVVFLFLVWVFMRAQRSMVREFVSYMKSKDEELATVMDENTNALRENTKVLGAALHVLELDDGET